jgi:hypothetical protein
VKLNFSSFAAALLFGCYSVFSGVKIKSKAIPLHTMEGLGEEEV